MIAGNCFFYFFRQKNRPEFPNNKNSLQNLQVLSAEEKAGNAALLLDYIVITETPVPTPTRKPTSTPTPTPSPIPVSSAELEFLFNKYSSEYGVNKELLRKIAYCESKFNPNAANKYYAGLFQFSVNTWINTRREMNMNDDPQLRLNAEESIRTAAYKLSRGGVGSWPNCQK